MDSAPVGDRTAAAEQPGLGSQRRILQGLSAERVQRLETLVELKKLYRNLIRAEALLALQSPVYTPPEGGGQLDKGWLQWSGSCCSTQLSSVLTWLISLHCWAVWCLDPCCLWVPAISSLLHNRGHNKTSLPYPANYLWCCLCRQCHGSRESSANSRSSSRGCR